MLNFPGEIEQIQAKRDLARIGQVVDHASLIITGVAGRFGQKVRGQRYLTSLHIPGEFANLQSVVQPTGAFGLQTLSPATIMRVPHSALRAAANRYPALAEALWRDCMVDASIMAQWIGNLACRNAQARVAHILCELAMRLHAAPAEGEIIFDFAVTQAQLGEAAGISFIHVNRTLRVLRESGIVTVRGGVVHIPDWTALVQMAEFDPAYLQADVATRARAPIDQAA